MTEWEYLGELLEDELINNGNKPMTVATFLILLTKVGLKMQNRREGDKK